MGEAGRSGRRRRSFAAALGLVSGIACGLARSSRAAPVDDPFQMIEERRVVNAASKRPEPVSETPSIVTVITAAEIRAHGYRTLAEALQWVRGFYTRYDRDYTYVGVRGLQRPGDYNNKVLLTIDGHTMNTPIYGDAAFGSELGLDMESVERLEIIRGPGSALYGSNAVLAVVNVVTRPARASLPVETGGSVGSLGERRAYLDLASARRDLPHVSLTGSWSDADGATPVVLGVPGPLGPTTAGDRLDGEQAANLLGHVAWRGFELAGKFNERLKHIPTGAYGSRLGDPSTRTRDGHDFVELSTRGQLGEAIDVSSRAYWDGGRYWGSYAYGPDSARVTNRDIGASDQVGAEVRVNWKPFSHHVTSFGTESRWVVRADQLDRDLSPLYTYTDVHDRWSTVSFYLQDEMQLPRGARLTAGGRVDTDTKQKPQTSPRLDLLVPLDGQTTWKLLSGSAYRSPVPYETQYSGSGGPAPFATLLPERVNSLESAIERRLGSARLLVSAYTSWARDLIDLETIDTLGTYRFFNRGRVQSRGLEGEIEWSPWAGGMARGDLAWQVSRDGETHLRLSNSPEWNAHLLVTQNPVHSALHFGFGVRWLGTRTTLGGAAIPAYALIDGRVAVQPLALVELGCEVRNLLNAHYADPGAPEHAQDALVQDERGVALTLTLRRPSTP